MSATNEAAGEIRWDWLGTFVGSATTTTYECSDVLAFAATRRHLPEFEGRGFTLSPKSRVRLSRHEASDAAAEYTATLLLAVERGELRLNVGVDLGAAGNIESLIVCEGGGLLRGFICSTDAPLPGGRGQRKAVLALARRLYELAGDVREAATAVEVYYATRGGKYGRMAKIARSSFPIAELATLPSV